MWEAELTGDVISPTSVRDPFAILPVKAYEPEFGSFGNCMDISSRFAQPRAHLGGTFPEAFPPLSPLSVSFAHCHAAFGKEPRGGGPYHGSHVRLLPGPLSGAEEVRTVRF